MTGSRHHPEEIPKRLQQLIRYENESLPVASLGELQSVDETHRRCTVETVPDGNVHSNVPIASPFAMDGSGDVLPLNPEDRDRPIKGIVLYLHHPIDRQLAAGGEVFDGEREHEEENAIFLPAMIWYDPDEVPEHDLDDRIIDHPDGSRVHLDEQSAEIDHRRGGGVGVFGAVGEQIEPEEDDIVGEKEPDRDYWAEVDEDKPEPDNTEWPIDDDFDETYAHLSHPSGIEVIVTKRGVAVDKPHPGVDVSVGRFTSGERKPLDGYYQHTHLLETADGPMLVGEHLSFREWVMWLTDRRGDLVNSDADWITEASIYAEAYLDWLEAELGREVDPTDPLDWPDPEPMPTPDERDSFVGGYGQQPYGAGGYGT